MGRGLGMGLGRGAIGAPLARLFANFIVMGSGVLGRHFLEAYQAALKSEHLPTFFAPFCFAIPLLPRRSTGRCGSALLPKNLKHN